MPRAKQASKRKRRIALPAMGIAGASLALTSGASAATVPETNKVPSWATGPLHEITLGEEEIADVSLATFYVFDSTINQSLRGNIQLARCGGCGGCGHGCGGCGRCGGIGIGCGGGWGCSCSCCWSWGFCRLC